MNGIKGPWPMVFNNSSKSQFLNPVIPFSSLEGKCTLALAGRLEQNPALLCKDARNYFDKSYVNSLSTLYFVIAKSTGMPLTQLNGFKISDFEAVLVKLSKEHPQEYKELCKYFGIVPDKHSSKKPTKYIIPRASLSRLADWGYIEHIFTNMDGIISMVARKTSTSYKISDLEKAKYAQIFLMFIVGHSKMYYDYENFLRVEKSLQEKGGSANRKDIEDVVLSLTFEEEKKAHQGGILLYELYQNYLSKFEDGTINIDAIAFFLDMIDYEYKLLIKEFMDMLTVYDEHNSEKTDFKSRRLLPLRTNFDIRLLKEKLFPYGEWNSGLLLFMTNMPEKYRQAFYNAFINFKNCNYEFGNNVQYLPDTKICYHPASKVEVHAGGYLYASLPYEVLVHDENELWLMKLV